MSSVKEIYSVLFFSWKVLNLAEKVSKTLEQMVGLNSLKEQILKRTKSIQLDRKRSEAAGDKGKATENPSMYHMVIMGNPGMGKMTSARLIAGL